MVKTGVYKDFMFKGLTRREKEGERGREGKGARGGKGILERRKNG